MESPGFRRDSMTKFDQEQLRLNKAGMPGDFFVGAGNAFVKTILRAMSVSYAPSPSSPPARIPSPRQDWTFIGTLL